MTAKQYLQSYRRLKTRYSVILEEYRSVESDMIALKSPNMTGDHVKSSAKNDPIGEMVIKLEDKKAKYGIWMVECDAKMKLIENQIRTMEEVNEDYYAILLLKYVLGKDWKFICDKTYMSRAQANKIHGKALQEFDGIYGKNYAER